MVDEFIRALEESDARALLALVEYSLVPCTAAEDRLPPCPPGAAERTPVDAFRETRCDGGWLTREVQLVAIVDRFVRGEFAVFAVATLPPAVRPIGDGGWPAGDYLVVMDTEGQPSGEPRAAILDDGGVVQLSTGCFSVLPRDFLEELYSVYSGGGTPAFVLPPLH